MRPPGFPTWRRPMAKRHGRIRLAWALAVAFTLGVASSYAAHIHLPTFALHLEHLDDGMLSTTLRIDTPGRTGRLEGILTRDEVTTLARAINDYNDRYEYDGSPRRR